MRRLVVVLVFAVAICAEGFCQEAPRRCSSTVTDFEQIICQPTVQNPIDPLDDLGEPEEREGKSEAGEFLLRSFHDWRIDRLTTTVPATLFEVRSLDGKRVFSIFLGKARRVYVVDADGVVVHLGVSDWVGASVFASRTSNSGVFEVATRDQEYRFPVREMDSLVANVSAATTIQAL